MVDLGLTHVALPVSNLNDSIAFYTKYARMQVVHRRPVPTTGFEVVWMSDQTRPSSSSSSPRGARLTIRSSLPPT